MHNGMEHSGIFLSHKALMSLDPDTRAAVLRVALGDEVFFAFGSGGEGKTLAAAAVISEASKATGSISENENFVELTPRMARKFVEGCGEKTRLAAETIARSDSRFFQVSDVASSLGVSAPELRGVWGGLTRRLKTITGDSEAFLIHWAGSEPVFDADGNYIDQRGELTEMTYQSLRKVFSL